jgi:ubiquinone/menaquinone biosynthesis C-methylase UbiE
MKRDPTGITASKIKNLLRPSELDILEIGCGDGRVTSGLRDNRRRIVAVDPEENPLATAKATVPDVDFRLGSGENLDFPPCSFDAVLFTLSLHHQDGQAALREACRVLKSGGMCLVLEPALDGEIQLLSHLFEDESQALRSARKAIEQTDFEHLSREVVDTDWTFSDREELHAHHFRFYGRKPDKEMEEKMDGFLGEKIRQQPIILKETSTLDCLRKG